MLHITLQLGIAAPILGALGLLLAEPSTMDRAAAPVSTGVVDSTAAAKGEPLNERVSVGANTPCSMVSASAQAESDAASKSVQPDMEFDEPFYVTLNSLNYIVRTTGATPVHHFDFADSSALKMTAKVGPTPSIVDTYTVGLR